MKKKVLLSSILTIALCLSLIAGSTFALFTDSEKFNIAVTAGKVDLTAGIAISKVHSVQPSDTGTIVDENGATYEYSYEHADTFINGGKATVTGAEVTLEKVTPGDKIDLLVSGTNNSNVTIQYRYVIECTEGLELMHGLLVYVNGATEGVKAMKSYTSAWTEYKAPTTDAEKEFSLPITIELPVDAGNEYQNKTTKIKVLVEAVQGNASVIGNTSADIVTFDVLASTEAELADAIANGKDVVLTSNVALTNTLATDDDVVIDLNGNIMTTPSSGAVFQSKSNKAPDITITSSVDGAAINVSGGDTSVLLGYGSTVINNVTINVTGCDNYSPNPFHVYGDLTLGEGTVVNIDYLGTALINNDGAVDIVIDGAEINIGTFKTNGTAIITLNNSSTLEIKNTEITIDEFVLSAYGGDSLVSKVDGVTIENCTFDVTDSNAASCTFEAKDGKYRLVQK